MKRTLLAAILATAAIAFSCTMEEPSALKSGSVVNNPTATIADFVVDGPLTKTTFSLNDNVASYAFATGDRLGAFPVAPEVGDGLIFTASNQKGTSCTFTGDGFGLIEGQQYAAYYPAPEEILVKSVAMPAATEVPVYFAEQYQPAANEWNLSDVDFLYATGIAPANGACDFKMQHIGALLMMDVTFPNAGVFTKLTLESDQEFVTAGTVDLTADEIAITPTETSTKIRLFLGGDEGIAVTAGQKVTFYVMVPPVDMSNASLKIKLTPKVGEYIYKEGAGANFQAGHAVNITGVSFPTNLSAKSTANSYIVDVDNVNSEGYYFDATVAGNGAAGVVTFPADFVKAYPASGTCALNIPSDAKIWIVLNQNDCVKDVTYANGKVFFTATGKKGNAKIAIDTPELSGDPYWTWHIWCTDQPSTTTYTTGSGNSLTVQDRNLGAITNAPSETLEEMTGLYYQFGNPIGYTRAEFANAKEWADGIIVAIHNPQRPMRSGSYGYTWFTPNGDSWKVMYNYMWSNYTNTYYVPIADITKTIYDPCPVGYQVAPSDLFNAFTETGDYEGAYADKYGIYVVGNNGDAFFPYNGDLNPYGTQYNDAAYGQATDPTIQMWTSRANTQAAAWCYSGYHRDDTKAHMGLIFDGSNPGKVAFGQGVRCVASAQ